MAASWRFPWLRTFDHQRFVDGRCRPQSFERTRSAHRIAGVTSVLFRNPVGRVAPTALPPECGKEPDTLGPRKEPMPVRLGGPVGHIAEAQGRAIDLERAERVDADLLGVLGVDVNAERLAATKAQLRHRCVALLTPTLSEATTFRNNEDDDELVVLSQGTVSRHRRTICFSCSEVAHVGTLPSTRAVISTMSWAGVLGLADHDRDFGLGLGSR